jgi:hypothetical protein
MQLSETMVLHTLFPFHTPSVHLSGGVEPLARDRGLLRVVTTDFRRMRSENYHLIYE